MIIGSGMIASSFSNLNYDFSDCILFASGVSNSKCKDPAEFEREYSLLKSTLKFNKRLIYFSTSSVFDPSLESSFYVRHKLRIESFINQNFKDYVIYRLPNIIGKTNNKNTLINYFSEAIHTGLLVKIFNNSTRYILDVDDVVKYVLLTKKKASNCIINLNFNINYTVPEIWKELEFVLTKKGKAMVSDQGVEYKVDNSLFISIMGQIEVPELNDVNYLSKTIQKYF